MKKTILFSSFFISQIFFGCAGFNSLQYQNEINVKLVDSNATRETVNLFYNLKKISQQNVIFGHQHSTAYGVGWMAKERFSDIYDVSEFFPGLYGWDFDLVTNRNPFTIDWMQNLIAEAYERGGLNIFCWHYSNPVTGKSFYDTTVAVKHILPGGSHHNEYKKALDLIAGYAKNLKDNDGNLIPVIFRPFHEFDGNWFWWGKNFTTKEEFISLWRFTVDYLKSKGVNNFLYAFSPDRMFYNEEDYLDRYPGDNYTDILGVDNYWDFTNDGDGLEWVTEKLKIVSDLAKAKNKIAAFTETGLEGVPDQYWWTSRLLSAVNNSEINIAFLMVWRNANEYHHYAPYKGSISAADFLLFSRQPKVLFEEHLPDLYSSLIDEKDLKLIEEKKRKELIQFFINYSFPF